VEAVEFTQMLPMLLMVLGGAQMEATALTVGRTNSLRHLAAAL
jgi:hypothetical protein